MFRKQSVVLSMMEVSKVVFLAFLLNLAGCADKNEVPEPVFEIFAPKGLRVSVPDFNDVKFVEFSINVPSHPETIHKEVRQKEGSHWVFWNPNVVVNLHDKISYKIVVRHGDLYCTREGTHVVLEVLPLSASPNDTDCAEREVQKTIKVFPTLEKAEEHRKGMITSGKSSNFKSSYSMIKNSNLKPITKTSTSTTSGTFFVKPSGVMEATGYKSGSTFDSTKREGEQWEHYRSDLTAEELENMRRLYESGLHSFPHLSDKFFPSAAKVYEKSYMTSESKSFPEVHKITYGEGPVTTQKFFQTHKTHQSSYSHGKPVFQFHSSSEGDSLMGSNRQSENTYRMEPLTHLPHPLPPQGTIFKATEYVREEHTVPEVAQFQLNRELTSGSTPQKIVEVSQNEEFSSHHNQEVVKPLFTHVLNGGRRGDQMEHTSGKLQTVDKQDFRERQDNYRSNHYMGSIFTSVKNKKVHSPQECNLMPGIDYTSGASIKEVEKYVFELSCLATLAESTIKDEMALLKQKYGDLMKKMEFLEQEVKRISATCNCYE